jgi:hypothetical protein
MGIEKPGQRKRKKTVTKEREWQLQEHFCWHAKCVYPAQ